MNKWKLSRKYVSCPACGKLYGYRGYGVCLGCHKCSTCCGCKMDGKVLVDADTFVETVVQPRGK